MFYQQLARIDYISSNKLRFFVKYGARTRGVSPGRKVAEVPSDHSGLQRKIEDTPRVPCFPHLDLMF